MKMPEREGLSGRVIQKDYSKELPKYNRQQKAAVKGADVQTVKELLETGFQLPGRHVCAVRRPGQGRVSHTIATRQSPVIMQRAERI